MTNILKFPKHYLEMPWVTIFCPVNMLFCVDKQVFGRNRRCQQYFAGLFIPVALERLALHVWDSPLWGPIIVINLAFSETLVQGIDLPVSLQTSG